MITVNEPGVALAGPKWTHCVLTRKSATGIIWGKISCFYDFHHRIIFHAEIFRKCGPDKQRNWTTCQNNKLAARSRLKSVISWHPLRLCYSTRSASMSLRPNYHSHCVDNLTSIAAARAQGKGGGGATLNTMGVWPSRSCLTRLKPTTAQSATRCQSGRTLPARHCRAGTGHCCERSFSSPCGSSGPWPNWPSGLRRKSETKQSATGASAWGSHIGRFLLNLPLQHAGRH